MIIERALTEEEKTTIESFIESTRKFAMWNIKMTAKILALMFVGLVISLFITGFNYLNIICSTIVFLFFSISSIIIFGRSVYSCYNNILNYKELQTAGRLKTITLKNTPVSIAKIKKEEFSLHFYQYTAKEMICLKSEDYEKQLNIFPNNNLEVQFYTLENGLHVLFANIPHGEQQYFLNTATIKGRFKKHLNLKSKYLNPNEFCIVDGTLDKLANIID